MATLSAPAFRMVRISFISLMPPPTVKGMNGQDYCVVFGNVEQARFKKRRTYINPEMDSIHVNHLDQPVLMVPLIRMGEGRLSDLEQAWRSALEIGVREDFRVFFARIYGETFATDDPSDMRREDALRLIDSAIEKVVAFMPQTPPQSIRFRGLNRGRRPENVVALSYGHLEASTGRKVQNWICYASLVLRMQHGWSNDDVNRYITKRVNESSRELPATNHN